MNIPTLIKYIEEEMKSAYACMEQRVRDREIDATEEAILSIMDDLPFGDPEDSENHNYDLGRYKALEEIKNLIADDNHTAESVLEIMKKGGTISFNSGFRFESDLEEGLIRMYHSYGSDGMTYMNLEGAKIALANEKSYRELISNG